MSVFSLPEWIKPHLYTNKGIGQLTESEFGNLKERLSNFSHPEPLISVVIPAWNEENNLFRTLSSLASNEIPYPTEIIVINNNSTDNTQGVLDSLGITSYSETQQGPSHARQKGLAEAKGKYYLCADSDTFYPPKWIACMVKPMIDDERVVGVYGRYSFVPDASQSRFSLYLYECVTSIIIRIRQINQEFVNVLGFNMGFVTDVARTTDGFKVMQARKFDNALGSDYFIYEAEDGTMALNLLKKGKLKLVTDPDARVFTSSRRLSAEGGVFKSFLHRLKLHTKKMTEYLSGN